MTNIFKAITRVLAAAAVCAALSACSPSASSEGFPSTYGTPAVSSQGSNLSIMDLN